MLTLNLLLAVVLHWKMQLYINNNVKDTDVHNWESEYKIYAKWFILHGTLASFSNLQGGRRKGLRTIHAACVNLTIIVTFLNSAFWVVHWTGYILY